MTIFFWQRLCATVLVVFAVIVSVSPLAVSPRDTRASDLQATTDKAAVEAKKKLCIALNGGADAEGLKEAFLAYYEGKKVSAKRMYPGTFSTGEVGPLPPFEVRRVMGPKEMLAEIDSQLFKLSGFDTDDVANGQVLKLNTFFVVQKTETSRTVAGGTSVFVLKPADKEIREITATRVYPWYSRENKVVITGELVRIEGPYAFFMTVGGERKVLLGKFTRGDREVMRMLVERHLHDQSQQEPPESPPQDRVSKPVGLD
jgi:hypothetical protein